MRLPYVAVVFLFGLALPAAAEPVGVKPRTAHTFMLSEGVSPPTSS